MGDVSDDQALVKVVLALQAHRLAAALRRFGRVVDADVNGVLGVAGEGRGVGDAGIAVVDEATGWVCGIDEVEGGEEVGRVVGFSEFVKGGGACGAGSASDGREGDEVACEMHAGDCALFASDDSGY